MGLDQKVTIIMDNITWYYMVDQTNAVTNREKIIPKHLRSITEHTLSVVICFKGIQQLEHFLSPLFARKVPKHVTGGGRLPASAHDFMRKEASCFKCS